MLFDSLYYEDSPQFFESDIEISQLVPHSYSVALNGVEYMVDFNQPFYRQYRRQLASLVRTQADTSTDPGEQTLDPNGLWRRSFEDWSLGAGQRYLDRKASLTNNFWQSQGLDVLTTKWQVSLLNDTSQSFAYSATNFMMLLNVGSYTYAVKGANLYFASNGSSTFSTTALSCGNNISSICSDGANIWVCAGASGIYTIAIGATTGAVHYITGAVNAFGTINFVNGRIMFAEDTAIYNLTTSGSSLPTALFSTNTGYFRGLQYGAQTWAEGNDNIYVIWNQGAGGSYIYGITIDSSGETLDPPTVQAILPYGEAAFVILGYLGNLIVGTSLGVRFCQVNASGGISLGSLIPTAYEVSALACYNRWVYFSLSNYTATATGVGRMDLENFVVENVLPAYASDLMSTESSVNQGFVNSIAIVPPGSNTAYPGEPLLMFTVMGVGAFAQENGTIVGTGYVDSGYILYDLVDAKIATLIDVATVGPMTEGSYIVSISVDAGTFEEIATVNSGDGLAVHSLGLSGLATQSGERFEVRLTLVAGSSSAGPTLSRWTLKSYPAPKRALTWQLPLILDEAVVNMSGAAKGFVPLTQLQFLEGLANSGELVVFQEGENSYQVYLTDCAFLPDYTTEDGTYFNGVALVSLYGIPGAS